MKVRDVHCIDTRDQRLLRPFHCQAVLYKPPAQLPCQSTPCLDWYTSSWREVGAARAGGQRWTPEHRSGASLLLGHAQQACLRQGVSHPQLPFLCLPGSTFGQRWAFACPEQMLSSWASAWPGMLSCPQRCASLEPPRSQPAGRQRALLAEFKRISARLQNLSGCLQQVCWILLPLGAFQPVPGTKKETTR